MTIGRNHNYLPTADELEAFLDDGIAELAEKGPEQIEHGLHQDIAVITAAMAQWRDYVRNQEAA